MRPRSWLGGGSSSPKRRLKASRSSSPSCWPRSRIMECRVQACSIAAKSWSLRRRRSTPEISAPTASHTGRTVTAMSLPPLLIFLSPLGERLGEGVQREDCLLHHPVTQPLPQGGEEHEGRDDRPASILDQAPN